MYFEEVLFPKAYINIRVLFIYIFFHNFLDDVLWRNITFLYEFDNMASEKNNNIIIGGTHTLS